MKTQQELVKELFSYLDYQEESDSGNMFNPIYVSCCRSLMMERVGECLRLLKESILDETP